MAIPTGAASQQVVKLSKEEIQRYSRHLIMPEVGMEGQEKLKKASILLIGCGGLGSPLSMYLSAAGVGHLADQHAPLLRRHPFRTESIERGCLLNEPRKQKRPPPVLGERCFRAGTRFTGRRRRF